MRRLGLLAWLGMMPVWAGEMPEKAADYHAALLKRPESAQLFERFRNAWLEERSVEDLEKELLARAGAGEAGAWATLARAWLAAGKSDQALEAFDKARKQSPAAWLDLEAAKLRMAAKDFAAAEKDALGIPEGDPQRPEALKLAGLACLRAERIDEALAHWTKAVAAAPGDNGLLEDLTELTRREGRFDLALDYCGKWRDATADPYGKAMATLRRAELLLGSQRFDEAMTELAAVLEVAADDSWLERETLVRAEQAHRQRGNSTGWAKWIGAQAGAHPSRLNFLRASAQALAAAGKPAEALTVLTEVMKRSPGDMTVRWQRIGLLEQSMQLAQAYGECLELAAKEKSETAGLRLAELAFRLEKKDELKRALDDVLAAADPAKRVGLAGLYARYGLPEGSERIWREEAGGEQGGQALRLLAKHLKTAGRDKEAVEIWKQLGARDVAQDRIEAAQLLAAAGERGVAREILMGGREKFSAEPGYEAMLADLAITDEKPDEARAIYLKLARAAKRPDEIATAAKGWLRASAALADPLKDLGEETADRCLRAAWLAAAAKPLPMVRADDELERAVRLNLLREQGRWPEVVAMMDAVPGERGPIFLSELAEAKTAAGDLPGALVVTQAWRGRVPDQAGPWLSEAGTLEKLGRQSDAAALMRRAAARFEDNEDIARRLFTLLQQSPDPREALDWAWKRHDRSPDESVRAGWLRDILQVSKQSEQLDDLQARFEERARRDPASPGPLIALAELAKAHGDSQAELDFLRRAVVNAPRDTTVISTLAALEESSGETALALERRSTLARLAPGPDSARNLAQAKIRLGDIEGGMRDMQALAGEKGIDLRALEQSAGDLASRGYVEEAIRLLAAVDPAQRTARLYFVLGTLLDIDGRERDAVDAFIKVIAEPDDPAEAPQEGARGYGGSTRTRQYSQMFQSSGEQMEGIPGMFRGLQVPQSLAGAKAVVKSRLSRLAMQQGGEIWEKAATVVPELASATPEQWREVMEVFQSNRQSGADWWDFIASHPGNPLGLEMLLESGLIYRATPGQTEALLKTNLAPRVQIQLRYGKGEWRADNLKFLESIQPADWQDETFRIQAVQMVERMFMLACREDAKTALSAADCARGLAVLEKAGLVDREAIRLEWLRARLALLEEKPDEFVTHIDAWSAATGKLFSLRFMESPYSVPLDAFEHWRKKAGAAAAEALVARIGSPALRCQLANDPQPEQRIARVNRELAALPQDAPAETRRSLVRISWSLQRQNVAMDAASRKELEAAAADESDLRLALEARIMLASDLSQRRDSRRGGLAAAKQLEIQKLIDRLRVSPDPGDQAFAGQYGGYSTHSPQQAAPPATGWGTYAGFSQSSSGRNRRTLPAIIALEDRGLAAREAARFLETVARASAGRGENLRDEIKTLSDAGLLEDALARISLPPDAGLGRRVAMITLLDACSKPDRARELLAEMAKARPWETRWTAALALRSTDDAEMRRLLDSISQRGDFDRNLNGLLVSSRSSEKPGELPALLTRLAEWAPQAKGSRGWMETAMTLLTNDLGRSSRNQVPANNAGLECLRRYVNVALDDRRLAEFGFRILSGIQPEEPPEAIADAARRALLSGAYTSSQPTFSSTSPPQNKELSALAHLVLMAAEKGDEAVFPAEFRERLKPVDPESEAWLAKMLAAKTVAELPDISANQAGSIGWVAMVRRESALLRAVKMPGRDSWLTGVFGEKNDRAVSENLRLVLRESLLDAAKSKKLPDRVFGWLEAAAGPRKSWNKEPEKKDPAKDPFVPSRLLQVASIILNGAAETDPATMIAVLDLFREARVPVGATGSVFLRLGQSWNQGTQPPGKATLAELLGSKREAAYTLGVWQPSEDASGKMRFAWGLPQILQNARLTTGAPWVKAVKDNPDAAFPDLLQAWLAAHDKSLQRRALLKAAPDLAKFPAEIRRAVIGFLITGMDAGDLAGLPAQAAAQLRENLDAARKQRIGVARETFESIKAGSTGKTNMSNHLGSLLGPVMADDEALVTEVIAVWRPVAEADKSGKEIEAFMSSLVSHNNNGNPQTVISALRLLDSLWKGSPPPPRNSNRGDLMDQFWNGMPPQALGDPDFWRQMAGLSPKMQARFWTHAPEYGNGNDLQSDPKLVTAFREAAKGSEVTRTALEWRFRRLAIQQDRAARIDGAALLAFAKALKDAGSSPEDIAGLLCGNYGLLPRMENPGTMMAETPVLLAELKAFSNEQAGRMLQGIQELWDRVLNDRRKNGVEVSATALPAVVYPVETAALLKFIFSRGIDVSRGYVDPGRMTQIVLSLNEPDLLELWVKVGGKSLAGDIELVIALLERDRVPEAVALAPTADREVYFRRRSFTRHLESLVAKLHTDPSPLAFRLAARLSMLRDAEEADAPVEKQEDRRKRLVGEFERIRSGLPVLERAALCLSFGLDKETGKNIPALDDFASDQAVREFRGQLTGGSSSALARLFIPAVFSRAHAGDLSGIDRLTAAIIAIPAGRRSEVMITQNVIFPVHTGLVGYIGRPGARMTPVEMESVLACIKALAATTMSDHRGMLSQLVHFVATDAASLEAGLRRCGLEGVKPDVLPYRYFPDRTCGPATWRTSLRLALLHPLASDVLMDSLYPLQNPDLMAAAFLPALADPGQRARLSPAIFIRWTEELMPYGGENLKLLRLYADEHRKDFDQARHADIERLLGSW